MPAEPHAVIIGAGIVGTSCAYFLQRDGWRVTLVDAVPPGHGASLGNAGIISLGSILPVATPGILRRVPHYLLDRTSPFALRWAYLPRLLPWLYRFVRASRPERATAIAGAIAALVSRADAAHDLVIQGCGLGDLVHRPGWLKVARSQAALDDATALDRAFLDRHGVPFELLDAAEVHELEPALAPEIACGLYLRQNRAVRHPQRYVAGIAETVRERGGEILHTKAKRLIREGAAIRAVKTGKGRLRPDLVVLAGGAFSHLLLQPIGLRIPLESERGYHVMLPHPARTLHRPVYAVEHGFVLAPMLEGLRLTGGVELASPFAPPDFRRIRRLARKATCLVPDLQPQILSEWLGRRPSLPDSLPVLGRAPGIENLILAFGHQHIGLTLGPLTGRLVADIAAGRDPGLDLTPYRADRTFR